MNLPESLFFVFCGLMKDYQLNFHIAFHFSKQAWLPVFTNTHLLQSHSKAKQLILTTSIAVWGANMWLSFSHLKILKLAIPLLLFVGSKGMLG